MIKSTTEATATAAATEAQAQAVIVDAEATAAVTAESAAANVVVTPSNGDIPLIAVNGTPFMTPVVTSTNRRFVAPRMSHAFSHGISLTYVQTEEVDEEE